MPKSRSLRLAAAPLGLLAFLGCTSDSDSCHGWAGFVTQSVVVADLDGRGGPDVLAANAVFADGCGAPGFLGARLQDPSAPGSFLDPLRSDGGAYPLAIAVGDLDGDGRPDAVVADYLASGGSCSVGVHLQSTAAPGTFLAPARLDVGSRRPLEVALADLKGEDRLDIILAASGARELLVFFHGTTPGTFLAPVPLAISGEPASVAAGDLNGDGRPDLAVAMANAKVAVLLNEGGGTFGAPVDLDTGADPVCVRAADLDGDGQLDLLTANYSNGTGGLSILRQAPGNPGAFLAAVTYDTGDYASTSVAVGDLDGDGLQDVVVANAGLPGYPGSVAVFLKDSSDPVGLFQPDLYRGYFGPSAVAIADFKGDGHPALVVADGDPTIRWPDPASPGGFLAPVWLRQ